jgi:NADH-quinone oxidoreductase subunit H
MNSLIIKELMGFFPTLSQSWAFAISILIYAIAVLIFISIFDYLYGWFERKVMAKAQSRHGPNTVGKYGVLQNLADIIKLLTKESIVPKNANKYLLILGVPMLLAMLIFLIMLLPFSQNIYGVDLSIGLLVIFVILSFSPILLFIAGWATGNKFASISSQRSIMILIGYELPMLLALIAVAVAANSYNLLNIVAAQSTIPFIIIMPIGFVIFFITLLAELERPPFDLREADSELIAGWLTDVSAPYYAQALFIDYTRVLLGSLLVALLFLGGWSGPILPGVIWLLIKVLIVAFVLILIRISTVRMRVNKVIRMGWMYLIPLAVINLLIVSAFYIGVI